MIQVTIGNNLKRKAFNISPDMTLRAALEQYGPEVNVDYTVGMMSLDGSTVSGAEFDKSFREFGYTGEAGHNKCFLLNVVKADNA